MTTKEKNNEDPFNSDYEEKLLLDEWMSTPHNSERLCTSYSHKFICVHEKNHYSNMYKTTVDTNCQNNKQSFKQKLMVENEVRRGKTHVC